MPMKTGEVIELEPEIILLEEEPIKRSLVIETVPIVEPEKPSQMIQTENLGVVPVVQPVEVPKPVVETPVQKPVNKKSKFFWFTDDDDDDDRLDLIEKKQKVLYSLLLCGTSNSAECKNISQMAMQLFNKILGNDDDSNNSTTTAAPAAGSTAATTTSTPPVVLVTSSPTPTTTTSATTTTAIPIPANAVPIGTPTP